MDTSITLGRLAIGFIPVLFVLFLMWRAGQDVKKATVSLIRMLVQLLLVGYFLLLVFSQPSPMITLGLLMIMMVLASWLALNVTGQRDFALFKHALVALSLGGGSVLVVTTHGVLNITPWYNPQFLIPLAGMVFAGSMTAISLALERFESEIQSQDYSQAVNAAFKAAMIPVVNSLLAVGVVSLPGMMTGQILSGVAPYIAARYQIMVMCMIFSSTGLTVFLFLKLHCKRK